MAPLRGRLTAQDYADLAAITGDPEVPSPALGVASARGVERSGFAGHLPLPPGAFGTSRAAGRPEIVAQAVNSIAPMAPLRGRLTAQDYAALAAFIGDPEVPSPALRLTPSRV